MPDVGVIPFVDLQAQYRALQPEIDRRMQAVLAHGRFVLGPEVGELEARLAAFAGVRHCVSVANGTDALALCLRALGIGPGDEVITTPFTFAASAEAILLAGATPVFVDIRRADYNLDPAGTAAAVTPRTRAILAVSLYGRCADFDAINAVAGRHGLAVIEDAAQSFGATGAGGRRSCALSRLATTSFYPSKPLGCYGDGGACFTDDAALADALRQLRHHGQAGTYEYRRAGTNSRLDTLQAAVLLAKLERFPWELEQRAAVAARYEAALAEVVKTPGAAPGSAWAQYTVEVERRDEVCARLSAQGVPTAVHYPQALHRTAPYRQDCSLPNAEAAAARVLSLPMHAYLDAATQDRIVAALRAALAAPQWSSAQPTQA